MLLSVMGFAQSTNFGLSMGVNFTNFVGRVKIPESQPRIGICPGVLLDIPMAYESYLELGAIYSQQGVMIKKDGFPGANTHHVISKETKFVDYVTIPVLWKQTFGDLYVKAGPFLAVATKATSKLVTDTITRTSYVHYDSSKDTTEFGKSLNQSFVNSLRQYDVGASFNVGFQTSVARGLDLFVDASYKIGFFSVEEQPATKNSPLRNQYFQVTAGMFFVKNRSSKTYRGYRRR